MMQLWPTTGLQSKSQSLNWAQIDPEERVCIY